MGLPGHYAVVDTSTLQSYSPQLAKGPRTRRYEKCVHSCREEDRGMFYTFPNEKSFEDFRADYQKRLSAFKYVNTMIILEILKLLDPNDISLCRKSARFLNRYIDCFSRQLRAAKLDITINSQLLIKCKYRCGKQISSRQYSHTISSRKVTVLNFYKDNLTISHLRFSEVRFTINQCIKIFLYLWDIHAKVDELIINNCDVYYKDLNYPGCVPPYYYFFMLLHQIAAKTIRINKSNNVTYWSRIFLSNSSMHNTLVVFFTDTPVRLLFRHVRQAIVHLSSYYITVEWRNPDFSPRESWNRNEIGRSLTQWMRENVKTYENGPPTAWYLFKGIIKLPLEQQSEIKEATIEILWSFSYFTVYNAKYK